MKVIVTFEFGSENIQKKKKNDLQGPEILRTYKYYFQ